MKRTILIFSVIGLFLFSYGNVQGVPGQIKQVSPKHADVVGGCAVGSPNISDVAGEHWAWNDVIGWIDFLYVDPSSGLDQGSVEVKSNKIEGCVSSSVGIISLNCATTPIGDVCNSNFSVSNNQGNLAGWAWSDTIGWISFCGTGGPSGQGSDPQGQGWQCPNGYTYNVFIDSNGDFHGWAWNDVVGWISFNCLNTNTCGVGAGQVSYKVKTDWTSNIPPPTNSYLLSSVFATCPSGAHCAAGAALNSILWQGQLNGGDVQFQVASSRCVNGATDPYLTPLPDGNGYADPVTGVIANPVCNSGGWCDGSSCAGTCSTENSPIPGSLEYPNYPPGTNSCFVGPNGDAINDFYPGPDNIPILLNLEHHNNKLYARYKVFLNGNPVVEDVILNFSH